MQAMPPELEKLARQAEEAKRAHRRPPGGTGLSPQPTRALQTLRATTKLIAGPVAVMLTGARWKSLRRRLLAQASKIPSTTFLDMAVLEQASAEMFRINHDTRVLLEAYRLAPSAEELAALRQRTQTLAAYLIRIYRLKPGDAIELEWLAGPAPAANQAEDERQETA